MAGEWRSEAIGDLCDRGIAAIQTGPFGSQLHAHEYRATGTPVVPTEAIGRRRLFSNGLPRVDDQVVERLARHRLRAGDILFARRGAQATGSSAIVEKNLEGALCGTGAILMRVRDTEVIDPTFLSFALASPSAMQWLRDHAVGAVMPNLNADVIRRLEIPVPPINEQRDIAAILGTLDDKIELNRKMNETLEAMARALFKSWFVDFDPVRAKAEGRPPSGMDAETAKLFPSEFVESELGPIPKGWRQASVGDLLALEYGKALKESERQPGTVLVFGSNGVVGKHSESLVQGTGIVVGRKGNPGTVTWAPSDFFVIDTAFYVVPKDPTTSLRFLRHLLEHLDLQRLSADSAVPGVNRNAIYAQHVVRPSDVALARFHDLTESWGQAVARSERESSSLGALRDELLPRLLSGVISPIDLPGSAR